ncbi:MAG TPA: O-antigen ligase family protein [Verrucomicrobiae bacterium]|nr:O-antigen ligase family protein [Verrucomicrobiae bacterium]
MNSDPANVAAALRSLVVYAACAVVSIIIGVLMTNPMTYTAFGFMGILCAVLLIPILMKWHRPLMIFSWFTPIMMFFVKGDPNLFLVMIVLSLTATIVERAMGQKRFFNVPQITWPLFCLIGVVLLTAKLTGGLGLRAFGSEVYGGKKYIFLVVAILGYFAIASSPIPPEKARKYVALYFSGGILCVVQDFYQVAPHFLRPVYWLIPPNVTALMGTFEVGVSRLAGTGTAATALINVLIATYGLRGIFLSGKLWRPFVFFISFILIFFGGFRSAIIGMAATFLILFFLEGLHRTRLAPFLIVFVLAIAGIIVPLGSKLPFTFQRALSVLPPSFVQLSPDARADAKASWDWRIQMWTALLPQIPKHLLLGKGYAISPEDYDTEMGAGAAVQSADPAQQALALSSDYHNGPLSVILPFGIWGVIAMVWFFAGSIWVVYRNYRYSPPELKTLNAFLFATYVWAVIIFYGSSLATGMNVFTGLLGLTVAINRGVRRKPVDPAANIPYSMPFRRRSVRPASASQFPLPNPRFK